MISYAKEMLMQVREVFHAFGKKNKEEDVLVDEVTKTEVTSSEIRVVRVDKTTEELIQIFNSQDLPRARRYHRQRL